VTRGEVAIVYGDTVPALRTAARTFRADGYEPVAVPTVLRPLTDWPAATDVKVSRLDDGRILYKVAPPTIDTSCAAMFRQRPVAVYLASEAWDRTHRLTPQCGPRAFLAMPTVTISVRLEDRAGVAELLNYVTEADDESAVVIRPQYPKWAFIRVNYHLADRDAFDSVIGVARTGWVHAGISLYPGMTSFGPLPVDRYEFRILRAVRGIPRVLKTWGPTDVHEGLNALEWPD
jgi:hypothetical protein